MAVVRGGGNTMKYTTLIDAAELTEHLHDPEWVIFDCRFDLAKPESGRERYIKGHLPNAFFLDIEEDLSTLPTGTNGRHPLPKPERLAAQLSHYGVGNDTQIIVYDDGSAMFAARLWWMLKWIGHEQAAVLDGGLEAWQEIHSELTEEIPNPRNGTFTLSVQNIHVDADYVLAHLDMPDVLLIDARSADRYRGEIEPHDPVAGHIPGAVNRFFGNNVVGNRFKPVSMLHKEFTALLGEISPENVIHHCGSGVTACQNILAMEHAGLKGSKLYAGSWSEWCSDPKRPMVKGPDKGNPTNPLFRHAQKNAPENAPQSSESAKEHL